MLASGWPYHSLQFHAIQLLELKHALNLTKVTRLSVDEKFLSMVLPVAKERGIDLNHIYVMKGNAEGRKSFWRSLGTLGRKGFHLWVFELPQRTPWPTSYFSAEPLIYFFLPGFNSTDVLLQPL
jgi:hypothetical protein